MIACTDHLILWFNIDLVEWAIATHCMYESAQVSLVLMLCSTLKMGEFKHAIQNILNSKMNTKYCHTLIHPFL